MKINIPHIHKIEGEAGFWAKVTKTGQVEELKINTLLGLRQIEGLLIGRKVTDVPLIVSRVCGICPVVHILNACCALENALEIEVSNTTKLIRKLLLASQMIQSHTLHLFFMALPDFFNLENDLELMKKFPKEAKAALNVREFSLKIIKSVGGRVVHPLTPHIGGFLRLPEKSALTKILDEASKALESALLLAKTFQKINYPEFQKQMIFASIFSEKEYPFYKEPVIKIEDKKITAGDFFSNQIEEDLKNPPVKKVKFQDKPYMLGAIARVKNNGSLLNPISKEIFAGFNKDKGSIFTSTFHNLFFQALEAVHFIEETEKLTKEILNCDLAEKPKDVKISKGSGLSAMEAPRGTLFTYFEVDENGKILNCSIITPTAQFLNNLEDDLKIFLPKILKLSQKEKERKIRALVRVYDPCISCATH